MFPITPGIAAIVNGVPQEHSGRQVEPLTAKRMLDAVEKCDVREVEQLLAGGFSVTRLPIERAIASKSIPLFQTFIDYGWNVNSIFRHGKPPALAYVLDDTALTQWFLAHGADPNAPCHLDFTPMSVAVATASTPTIVSLFEYGGSVKFGQLLWHAVNRTDDDIFTVLDKLLRLGAPLNEIKYASHMPSFTLHRRGGLCTPLHRAVDLGKVHVVRFLIDRGADPRIRSTSGRSALDEALATGDAEMLNALAGTSTNRDVHKI